MTLFTRIPFRHAFARSMAALIVPLNLASLALSAGLESVSAPNLPVLLGVSRAPNADQWMLLNGQSRSGRCLNETFRLQTTYGLVELPIRELAALDLTRQRVGVDAMVTASGDRFSGVLLDSHLILQATNDVAPVTLRRETVDKLIFRLASVEHSPSADSLWVILRNGDFCRGQIGSGSLRLAIAGEDPREIPLQRIDVVSFPEVSGGITRVQFPDGQRWEGLASPADLRVDLDIGPSLDIYSDRIVTLRRAVDLPREFAERLGIPATPADRPPGPAHTLMPGLVWIPPGEFTLGSPNEEKDRDLDEGPLTRVVIPDGFWMTAHEVTQADYETLMGRNPSQYTGDNQRPVEKVNWQEAADYCRALNAREQAAGRLPDAHAFRLPTEAEWEYACRAGSAARFSHGDDPGYFETPNHAWCSHNSDSSTHPVGSRKSNGWGLFDMHGNVWEWCLDEWTGAYAGGTITNVVSTPKGSLRVARGGSWLYDPRFSRSANRDSYGMLNRCSDVGFRVVLARIQ